MLIIINMSDSDSDGPSNVKEKSSLPFSVSLPPSPAADENCSICGFSGFTFKNKWIGCFGCSYWVCAKCAFKASPFAILPGPTNEKRINAFYENIVLCQKMSSSPGKSGSKSQNRWQFLCPTCTNDVTSRRVLSPISSTDVQGAIIELKNDFKAETASLSSAIVDIGLQIKKIKSSMDLNNVSPIIDSHTNEAPINALKDEFTSKFASLSSVITDIGMQLKDIKASSDTNTKSYAEIVKSNLEMPKSMSNTIKASVKSMANELDSNKVLIFSRLPETNNVVEDNCLVMRFIDGLVPEGGVTIEDNEIRDVVRLGRPREDLKRLTKVTFTNERSVRLILEYHRKYAKDRVLPESLEMYFENVEELLYTKFGIRPDMPEVQRDIIKKRAQKVYGWNKEICAEAESKGKMAEVSYSLRSNGAIHKFVKNQQNVWLRQKEWKINDKEE